MKIAKRVLYVVLLVVVSTELVLRADPFGVLRYLEFGASVQSDGHVLSKQVIPINNGVITVLDSGARYVPDSGAGDCKMAVVGDSMSWGWSVDDHATWVNLVAQELPSVEIVNYAVPGYNVQDAYQTILNYPEYDGYIYLYFENDNEINMTVGAKASWSAILTHLSIAMVKPDIRIIPDVDVVNILKGMDRTFTFTFDRPISARIARLFPMTVIPFYTSMISKRDWHPDDAGHRQIYEDIREPLIAYITNTCANSAKAVVQ